MYICIYTHTYINTNILTRAVGQLVVARYASACVTAPRVGAHAIFHTDRCSSRGGVGRRDSADDVMNSLKSQLYSHSIRRRSSELFLE